MFIYLGFDDTDIPDAQYGTGKLARWFENELSNGYKLWGVVRQQLLIHENIPYTSHNSSACVIIDAPDPACTAQIIEKAVSHVERFALPGSDPGICVAREGDPALSRLVAFGRQCTHKVVSRQDALTAASKVHLSAHGKKNTGIIGATAAVGLTAYGHCGRFIEFGGLRDFPEMIRVSDLERANIAVVSIDRDCQAPAPEDNVYTKGWLRPRLWGGRAVLCAVPNGNGIWESLGERRKKKALRQNASRPKAESGC
jgi:hypothetical protein